MHGPAVRVPVLLVLLSLSKTLAAALVVLDNLKLLNSKYKTLRELHWGGGVWTKQHSKTQRSSP